MLSPALATMLLLAADPAVQAREGYALCLKEFVRSGVEKKIEAAAFDSALKSACLDKEALFKNARMSADGAVGIKRAESQSALAEEITDYRNMAREDFVEGLKASAPQSATQSATQSTPQ